jgi:hypothetical protein
MGWLNPQDRTPVKSAPMDSRITLSYILMPFAALLIGVMFAGITGSRGVGWASAIFFVLLEIAVINYARAARANYLPTQRYECRLCGYQWQQVDGDPLPEVPARS